MPKLTTEEVTDLAARALKRAGASKSMAIAAAKALVGADAEGLATHGVSRTALYAQHLREGRVDGKARPKIVKRKGATCLVDARGGLAYEASAITGAAFSFENDSYFEPGGKPRIGHAVLAIDPEALAGSAGYFERLEVLITRMLEEEGVRLPGSRRHAAACRAREEGIEIPDPLLNELKALGARQAGRRR